MMVCHVSVFFYHEHLVTSVLQLTFILLENCNFIILAWKFKYWYIISFQSLTFAHCSKSSFFVQKSNFDILRKLSIFWVWKTRENVEVLNFSAIDNFDFTRKIAKKMLGGKNRENVGVLSQLNFWTEISVFRYLAFLMFQSCFKIDGQTNSQFESGTSGIINLFRYTCSTRSSRNLLFSPVKNIFMVLFQ